MSTALDRAALEMKDILDDHDIEVPYGERIIVWRDLAVAVKFGTPKADCKRKLRKMIQLSAQTKVDETQEALFATPKETKGDL